MRRIYSGLLFLLVVSVTAMAQLPTASLNGTVTDPQGAVVSGAKITLTHPATGSSREGTTSSDGSYVFSSLAAGNYTMKVTAQGFATQEVTGIELEVGRAGTLNVGMKVAAGGEVITVTSDEAAVELTQSHVAGQIGASTVESIPLNGRNFLELAFLIPGNRPATLFDPTKTNTLNVSSAGAFGRGGNLTVDGGDNNDEVVGGTLANFPQDGVQEFQIATNRFTAEVGRSGSSIINIITKSGTNEYHGSAFFFFRHKELQGLPATFDRSQPTPPFDREQVGGSIGGPIKKDKAFWFVSLENRNQDAAVQVGRRDFATSTIIGSAADAPLDDFLLSARADFKLTEKDNLALRHAFNRSLETSNGSLARPQGTAANRQSSLNRFNSFVADWTRTISSNKVNSLIFHFDFFINEIPAFGDNEPVTDPAGLGVDPVRGPQEIRFPSLQDGANFRTPQRTRMNRYQIKDHFSWNVGKHNIRFGGEWQNAGSDVVFDLFGSGSVFTIENFGGDTCRTAGVPVIQCDRNADGVVDDLDIPLAVVVAGTAPSRPPTAPFYRDNYFGFYFQDDWKVLPNLTLNLGLRWDFDTQVLGHGNLSQPCPDPTVLTTAAGCLWLRNVLGPHDSPGYKNFGPRFGFAWDPFSKGTSVIRGGYGIYYDRVVLEVPILEVLLDGRVLQVGALAGSSCTNTGDCSLPGSLFDVGTPTLADPLSGGGSNIPLGGFNIIENRARHPLVHQFNFGIQHQFGRNWIVSGDAVHNFGQRLLIGRALRSGTSLIPGTIPLQFNDPDTGLVGTCPASGGVDPCFVTDPATGITDSILLIESAAKAWYSGLLANLQKKPTGSGNWKWGFNIAYTLSKSFNFANDDQIPFNGAEDAVNTQQGVNNIRLEKGYSPTDERHRFVFYGIFEMPWKLTFSPIWTMTSSVPIDARVAALATRLPLLQRNALARDISTGAELNAVITQWNALPACPNFAITPVANRPFPCQAGSDLGLVDPNLEFGDSFNSLDFRLTKTFTFAERHNLQLIGEAFNIFNITNIRGFNNVNYSGFTNDITSPDFNRPIRTAGGFFGSGGPRAFQFAVRYTF